MHKLLETHSGPVLWGGGEEHAAFTQARKWLCSPKVGRGNAGVKCTDHLSSSASFATCQLGDSGPVAFVFESQLHHL